MGYPEEGFVLAPALLPPDALAALVQIGERVHAQWMSEEGAAARERDLVNSTGLTRTRFFAPPFAAERPVFFDALAAPPLHDLLTVTFGRDLHFHGTQMFFNPLAGRRRPYWHRDLQYLPGGEDRQRALLPELCQLHVRLPLRPEKNFLLVPGTHARWDTPDERAVRLELFGHRSSEDLPGARPFDLQPGDVLVFSAHMLHRGTYEGNAARLSLDLMLARPHPAFPPTLAPDELPHPQELPRIRRPSWYRHP